MAYKTPGVYVEEISLFPPSVAEVATAIPAFIGYTEKAIKNGEDLTNKPTRVTSLLEYEQFFGKDWVLSTTAIGVTVDTTKNFAVQVTTLKRFYIYESLRLFYDNGGGHCYIVSVGTCKPGGVTQPDKAALEKGLAALSKFDEPTIIVIPDAAGLSADDLHAIQVGALAQCGTLQDRVAILDLPDKTVTDATEKFRNAIGMNNLKYGAAYAPWLITLYDKLVPFAVLDSDSLKDENGNRLKLEDLSPSPDDSQLLAAAKSAAADEKSVADKVKALAVQNATLTDRSNTLWKSVKTAADDNAAKDGLKELLSFLRSIATGVLDWRSGAKALKGENFKTLNAEAAAKLKSTVDKLVAMEKNTAVEGLLNRTDDNVKDDYGPGKYDDLVGAWISKKPQETDKNPTDYTRDAQGEARPVKDQAIAIAADFGPISFGLFEFITAVQSAVVAETTRAQNVLYAKHPIIGNIVETIKRQLSHVPPSGAVAGVYASVDSLRGVWKAPANVSLNKVLGPAEAIDGKGQEDLNVDVTAGKSINAIRAFTGRGTIVWGARTLAGNDNEWRYINVRRFFNMVEESVKKSTAWAVFEPNAAPLWIKVKGMIENYLIQKWREGALAGARPDDAFYVKVGLGQTMTAQDILEGKLNVEIGMAVVRPAEFIVLKFSHMMQKS